MAEQNISSNRADDLSEMDGKWTIGGPRHAIAVEAACEIEQTCFVLLSEIQRLGISECLAQRGMVARIKDLSCIVMGALSDECETTADIAERLRFEFAKESEAVHA